MIENPETGVLESFNFQHLRDNMPELKKLGYSVSTYQFDPVMDSSEIVFKEDADFGYNRYSVFFGSSNLDRRDQVFLPVCAQHADGQLRTGENDRLAEVFEHETQGRGGERPHAGIYIKYDTGQIYHPVSRKPLKPHYLLDRNIAILKLFPGISPQVVESILNIPDLKGVVMETFGSGNAPSYDWFLTMLKDAVDRGIVIVNVTQCTSLWYVFRYQHQSVSRIREYPDNSSCHCFHLLS